MAEQYCCGTKYACGNAYRIAAGAALPYHARFVVKCKADIRQHSLGEGALSRNDRKDRIEFTERRHDVLHDNAILEAFTDKNVNALLMTGIVVKFLD
jgi:hypothetical protein